MTGKTISHYKVLEKLGEGGMGVVYRAEDTKLERAVALKFLPTELTRDEAAKARFIREARAASALDHPNICTIHDVDETDDGQMFICMACYDGESLKARIGRGPLDAGEAIDIATGIAAGMAEAHKQGIIHRDIKPANVQITNDGRVKIVDFGLAKLTGQTGVTRTGTTVGTAAYMSPEQVSGSKVDHRSDIWSFGVTLYEMITGRPPFGGEYEQAVAYQILNEEPPPVPSIRPDAPVRLTKIIERSMARLPAQRYPHAKAILTDLRSIKTVNVKGDSDARTPVDDGQAVPSIAVLPFVNMSADPENAYFGDGLAEELINALTKLKGLRVAARTSAFRFRGGDVDIREIGQQLNVGTVLEGSVRRSGNRLRVTAQLINIDDGYHLWSERYDRDMKDIFDIQDDIAGAIVKQLEVKLVRKKGEPLVKRYTENLEAYTMFLEGQYHLFTLTPEGWAKSFELYQQAIELDPSFAAAHAWQSQNYQSLCFWGDGRPREEMENSRRAAGQAILLDDTVAMAHAVMAVIHWSYDWNWAEAEREFKRAFELDPTEPFNHMNYSLFLAAQGRLDDAITESRLGQKLDPLSSIIAAWGGISCAFAGLYEESVERSERAIALGPDQWQPYFHLGTTYLHMDNIDGALKAGEKAMELSGGASPALKELTSIYYLAGRTEDGDRLLAELRERAGRQYVAPSFFTEIHLARGEHDIAMEHLEKAVRERDSWLVMIGVNPLQIRPTGPRAAALLEPVGIK